MLPLTAGRVQVAVDEPVKTYAVSLDESVNAVAELVVNAGANWFGETVPPLIVPESVGDESVLFVSVWLVSAPTSVISASGTVRVRVVPELRSDRSNCICLVVSLPSSTVRLESLTATVLESSIV